MKACGDNRQTKRENLELKGPLSSGENRDTDDSLDGKALGDRHSRTRHTNQSPLLEDTKNKLNCLHPKTWLSTQIC